MEYWKARGAKLTLLVNQINTPQARMTLVTLRAAQSKILKVHKLTSFKKMCTLTGYVYAWLITPLSNSKGVEQH